ncbi:hypothetical protein BGZ73_003054 [Actinomortierella ambigua]|nr:hypothetical protein BGZ73_003054 [Actinomortierella ambigua]
MSLRSRQHPAYCASMWSIFCHSLLSVLLPLIIINASLPVNDYSHFIKATATVPTVTRTHLSSVADSNTLGLPADIKLVPIHSPQASYEALERPSQYIQDREPYHEFGLHCTTLPMQTPKPNAFLSPYIHS